MYYWCVRTFSGAGQAPGERLPQAPGNLGSSCGPLAATAGPPFSCAPKWDLGSHGCTHSAPYSCSPPELERSLILQKITCLNHTHSTITPDPQDASHQFPPRPPSSSNTQFSRELGSVGLKEALFLATVLDLVNDGQAGGRLPPWLPARPLAQEAPLQGHGTRSWIPDLNPKPRWPPGLSDGGQRPIPALPAPGDLLMGASLWKGAAFPDGLPGFGQRLKLEPVAARGLQGLVGPHQGGSSGLRPCSL